MTVKQVINRILLRNEVIFMLVFLLQLPGPEGTGIQVRDKLRATQAYGNAARDFRPGNRPGHAPAQDRRCRHSGKA